METIIVLAVAVAGSAPRTRIVFGCMHVGYLHLVVIARYVCTRSLKFCEMDTSLRTIFIDRKKMLSDY